ncbi:ATP-binding protein [Aromatoleum bremense]|uniref:ATP-binding protein n=1 Tax=Aromatoleum bremense TaxID=76115 RepID=A0ABX1NSR9_9RHOO|nr:ATP-binding protein [Aromatoleum bremense]NMG15030.1 ATP-binding protein [Aromatoleum bremense]QTQ32262.1 ABC transporter, ATP-binding protein [Aromatoleum bremense]
MNASSSARVIPFDEPAAYPRAPRTLDETGLPLLFLVELAAKLLFVRGQLRLTELSQQLRLPAIVLESLLAFMRAERICEVMRRGETDGDILYELTDAGRARAAEFLGRCKYAGAAPVGLAAYVAQVERQSVTKMCVTREGVNEAFRGLIIKPEVRDQLGAAMGSGRALFLYGPAGAGKTYLAERLALLLDGDVAVPHAILVDGEIIQVFDPLIHTPVDDDHRPAVLDNLLRPDLRWVRCRRPVAITGGELTLRMLDLDYDASTGFYQAPPHVKANGGLFVVDDLGRQLVTPEQLMNRWIVPMDRHHDHLALHSGTKFTLPFDVVLVFSTNLTPSDVADPAFLRRLGYKIHIGPMNEQEYRNIFTRVCEERGVPFDEAAFQTLLNDYHAVHGQPLLACFPRDIVNQIADLARYLGEPAQLTPDALHWAWHNYFAAQ